MQEYDGSRSGKFTWSSKTEDNPITVHYGYGELDRAPKPQGCQWQNFHGKKDTAKIDDGEDEKKMSRIVYE
jgi:hypothetical protein